MSTREVNFDGLVGPTHNYSGLSVGNLASQRNIRSISNPRAAAMQGLHKMNALYELGVAQAMLPPHERPAVNVLRRLGFSGRDEYVLQSAQRHDPELLSACSSASSMWAANAATVCPSADSGDGRVHFTVANLRTNFHRAIEASTTKSVLAAIFADSERFVHHEPLPASELFGDEGAANHTRLCAQHGALGLQLFAYGTRALDRHRATAEFPARQTFEASRAVARLHRLDESRVVYAQQSPAAIDAGVFHSDVIAVGNENVFFFHEKAFLATDELRKELESRADFELISIEVEDEEIPLDEAVATYVFNSQLVSLPTGKMALVVPEECRENARVWGYLQTLLEREPIIEQVKALDVRQSMRNGGGPACLRLRVVLTDEELESVNQAVLFDDRLFRRLSSWVDRHYRDRLQEQDLADPLLLEESRAALDELTQILRLGSIYPFQYEGR